MQHFFNDPSHVVDDLLDGFAHRAKVIKADTGRNARILLRADWAQAGKAAGKVAVLSGGGAGHEPAHAGYIGRGMLSGAISGDLFASPSVAAVLAAIREVCGEAGCLLIVKNYTGDRLNFGLAAERARQEGYKVAMVIVSDDIALPNNPQPRGLAGTVLVHKVAGYYAERGDSLEHVAHQANEISTQLASLAMALTSCTVPGQKNAERSPELGLGIHNEPGAETVSPQNATDAMRLVVNPLLAYMEKHHGSGTKFIVALNNLGGCSTQEMEVLCHELVSQMGVERIHNLVGPTTLMTSLDMPGFSLTFVPHTPEWEAALAAPTDAPAWPGVATVHAPEVFKLQISETIDEREQPQDDTKRSMLERAANAIMDARQALDSLDAKSGDGDTGATFAAGAREVLDRLESRTLTTQNDQALCEELGQVFAHAMGGSSGVLLSILFTATATALRGGKDLGEALGAGIERMQHYGGARQGDRTMLDALIPAADKMRAGASLRDIAAAARQGAEATATMTKANAGRSAYVPEDALSGVVDPGAEAVARVFEALAH